MPAPREVPISSLADFATFVEYQVGLRWYRGVGDSVKHELVPSLYRHPAMTEPNRLLDYERKIINLFKLRSVPFRSRPFQSESNWDLLFLMQHYGVPTRLLDWTENPFFGLYFALTQAKYETNDGELSYKRDAAIWVLNPIEWNNKAFGYEVPESMTANLAAIDNGYGPGKGIENIPLSDPAAIYGSYNSPRIVAQKGVFTMFGKSATPMEEVYQQQGYPADCLIKLVIDAGVIGTLLKRLASTGITDSVVFPDLEGLAREIKRQFEFWT